MSVKLFVGGLSFSTSTEGLRAAFARERDTRRRSEDDEAAVGIRAVDQRIQPAADERVVEGTDRKELLPLEVARHPELAEREEEVHLGDPELDMAARRRDAPGKS